MINIDIYSVVKLAIVIIIIIIIGLVTDLMPSNIILIFENVFFRLISILIIAYFAKYNPIIAILLVVLFSYILSLIQKKLMSEQFENALKRYS